MSVSVCVVGLCLHAYLKQLCSVSVSAVLCLDPKRVPLSIILESLARVEDSMYLSPLSELAKKHQREIDDVPVEAGVFRIEEPPHGVSDPSR